MQDKGNKKTDADVDVIRFINPPNFYNYLNSVAL